MRRTALTTTASAERPYISKSKFLWGSQCKKLLWYAYNAKDQIPEPEAAQQAIFDQGHEVGALAKSLYPGGIEVSADVTDFSRRSRNLWRPSSKGSRCSRLDSFTTAGSPA